ncbi:hypothetical protein [Granulicoccus sp. GXG6511]|uniref:hypothetical protein n=1 Tax=Granulicoccus sp. GXG6511 TaxID=3381351 RepID=UPI003D7C799D
MMSLLDTWYVATTLDTGTLEGVISHAQTRRTPMAGYALTTTGPRRISLDHQQPGLASRGKPLDLGTVFELRLWDLRDSSAIDACEIRWAHATGSAQVEIVSTSTEGARPCVAVRRTYLSADTPVYALEIFVFDRYGNAMPHDQLFLTGLE